MDIKDASIEDLQTELKHKQRTPPKMINADKMDFDPLMSACDEYIKHLTSDDYHINVGGPNGYQVRRRCLDLHSAIFENALTTFYGDDIWTWINSFDY